MCCRGHFHRQCGRLCDFHPNSRRTRAECERSGDFARKRKRYKRALQVQEGMSGFHAQRNQIWAEMHTARFGNSAGSSLNPRHKRQAGTCREFIHFVPALKDFAQSAMAETTVQRVPRDRMGKTESMVSLVRTEFPAYPAFVETCPR